MTKTNEKTINKVPTIEWRLKNSSLKKLFDVVSPDRDSRSMGDSLVNFISIHYTDNTEVQKKVEEGVYGYLEHLLDFTTTRNSVHRGVAWLRIQANGYLKTLAQKESKPRNTWLDFLVRTEALGCLQKK